MRHSAIIVDDENLNIFALKKIIETYASDSIEIVATSSSISEAELLINELQPTVLFLDVELDSGTSFDLLSKIKPYNYFVVFVTAFDSYMLQAFKFSACFYIVKPIEIDKVLNAIDIINIRYLESAFTSHDAILKIIKNFDQEVSKSILAVPEISAVKFLNHNEILYCKSDGRYTEIHLTSGTIHVSAKNIGQYEMLLPDELFLRVHKSYLVNLSHIAVVKRGNEKICELFNGVEIPVSKRRFAELLSLLNLK